MKNLLYNQVIGKGQRETFVWNKLFWANESLELMQRDKEDLRLLDGVLK